MKLVIAYIQPAALHKVKQALADVGVGRMSVANAQGVGQQGGYTETYRGAELEIVLRKKVRLEIAVNDDSPDMHGLQLSLDSGAGRLFLLPAASAANRRE